VATAICFAATAFAAAQLPEEIRVDLNLSDADLMAATKVLTNETGIQFVFEATAEPYARINLKLTRITAEEAISYICQAAGATYRKDANGVYVISRKKAGQPDVAPQPNKPAIPVPGKPKIVQKFKMRKADAKAIYQQLVTGTPQDPARAFDDLNRFQNATRLNSARNLGQPPILAGLDGFNFRPTSTNHLPANFGESGSNITLPGEGAGQVAGGGGGGLGQGGGGFGQGGGGGFPGGGGGGGFGQGGGQANLQPGQGLVGQSIDYISYDPTDNSIVVRGSEEDIADLQRWISMFDIAPRQVVIKVEFITTSSSVSRALGFDWLYERGTVFTGNRPGSFARAGDPIFLNYATGNITTRMRTLLQQGYGKVVQAPVIRTLNNQPASILQSVQTTLFVNQLVSVGNGQIISAPQPFQINIQTGLTIAPRINDDNTVTMFLNVPVQDFGQLRRSPDGTEIPDILSQVISVVARVPSGETIALGGMVRKQDTGSQAKFPVLGDLPLIGQFFRSSSRDRNNTELIIFVTPTIVADESSGGLGP
jgi:general secretion pathway protein D